LEYDIQFTRRAVKDLDKLPPEVQGRVVAKIEGLANVAGDVKKLTNSQPAYRLRVGDYRVLFDIEETTVWIQRILHRREAYDRP
jgi:mRNA interferase RelE/StbE